MEEAPVGPVAAVEAVANGVAEAANNFFNNPLSAVQPNVFQNIIPGVKGAIKHILGKKLIDNVAQTASLDRNIDGFFEDLKKANGLIAGGCILAAINIIPHLNAIAEIQTQGGLSLYEKSVAELPYKDAIDIIIAQVNDVDIYVPISGFPYLFGRMFDGDIVGYFTNPDGKYVKYRSSIYCESFLRRNGIKAVHRYTYPRRSRAIVNTFHFDVMAVRNKRTPLQVVNNFDLTFCQVWFDGVDCYATFPDHVNKKEGWVQKDYLPLLYRGNHFIKDRIHKYKRRGFKILENPELTPELAQAILRQSTRDIVSPDYSCKSVTKLVKRYEDPVFLRKWAIRMILDYLTSLSLDPTKATIRYLQPLVLHFKNDIYNTRHDVPDVPGIKGRQTWFWRGEQFKGINADDGYDTDEYEAPDLVNLKELTTNLLEGDDYAEGIDYNSLDTDSFTLLFYRVTNSLLEFLYKEKKGPNNEYLTKELGETLVDVIGGFTENSPNLKTACKQYLTNLREVCIRKSTDDLYFASEGDEVFDFHAHKLDKAISAENLEGYLTQYIKEADHESVPCYLHNPSEPANSCDRRITFDDIRYIVSPAFYAKYTAPPLIKTGLNQSIASLNTTLENTKSPDPVGFGDIYHFTMCPFCLQLENRDEGCAYMTHANPQRLPQEETPYCLSQFVVPEIREKYLNAGVAHLAEEGLNGVPPHLEFCIECGRPCFNHDHFDLNDPPRLLPHADPGICNGGKRRELFARILAVREVYRNGGFTDPKAERLAAARAADAAPRNPDLMARAQVISDIAPTERIWGNADVPKTKAYNDPAYRSAASENNNASNAGSENSFNAAAFGFENEGKVAEDGDEAPALGGGKFKKGKGKGYKLTRKLGKQLYKKSKPTKRR
jgi:hypothetical protein